MECQTADMAKTTFKLSEIRMRDPFIIESAPGEYTLFGTTDTNLWGGPGTGFDCYSSTGSPAAVLRSAVRGSAYISPSAMPGAVGLPSAPRL